MQQPGEPGELAARQVRDHLSRAAGRRRVTGEAVRAAAHTAAAGARWLGSGTGHLARGTVEGAVRAAAEIGGETTGFVRDSVIGVVEGTAQVVRVTTPAIREVVAGAVRGAHRASGDVTAASQDAVEGAIVGAASAGLGSAEAAAAAVDGAVEAVVEAGGNLGDAARASIGGVISGVSAAGGDVAAAVRDSAGRLIDHAGNSDGSESETAAVAGDVVAAVLSEPRGSRARGDEEFANLVSAAALGTVTAAYMMGRSHGDQARAEVVRQISQPRGHLSPEVQRQLAEVSGQLSIELPRVRGAWRWSAMARGLGHLLRAGATDQAASLAYFTFLSLFPLLALAIIASALVSDPSTIRPVLEDMVAHYLPASSGLVRESVDGLLDNTASVGLIALAGLAFSANGLFMAAKRAINRVFGVEKHRTLRGNVAEALLTGSLGIVLLASVGTTAFVQVSLGLSLGGENLPWGGDPSRALLIALATVAAILPAAVTGMVFIVVYHNLPSVGVEWRDAAFGGFIALVLFEAGKHLFFWLSGMAASRVLVYGPVAATVLLLMWAYVAGMIFLYGAGLARAAGELRPRPVVPAHGRDTPARPEE